MNNIYNKTFLVTGGTGSFGKKFVEMTLNTLKPKKIIIFSRDELKQFEMEKNLDKKYSGKVRFFIGDVRDQERLNLAMKNDVDILVHAAALKNVPIAEYNPFEAVKTNILGAQNVIMCALKNKVKKVIALSTDKAASPINLYGATKLASDKLFIAANNFRGKNNIKLSVVRYGNVMGSRGSVLPVFLEQSKKNYFMLTDKKMTRFNLTLKDGVLYVFSCLQKMLGGELFVPKIKSFKVKDMIHAISVNPKIKIIGTRPGEKLHEELITTTDSTNALEFKNEFIIFPNLPNIGIKLSGYKTQSSYYKKGKRCLANFSYNSLNNNEYLNIEDLKKLIKDFKKN
tara:strand:+ start:640 stop:1662 length:1023 start_codon:yes stop_codon:yes gene_type:complete